MKSIRLNDKQEKRLLEYLQDEIDSFIQFVAVMAPRWTKLREAYEERVVQKNFPWRYASNVHVPVTSTAVDAIHANMMNRIYSQGASPKLWDVGAYHKATVVGFNSNNQQPITWGEIVTKVGDLLAFNTGPNGPMRVYDAVEDGTYLSILLGTNVWLQEWVTLERPRWSVNDNGVPVIDGMEMYFDGILTSTIPLEDFVISQTYSDIHGPNAAPLVGHRESVRRSVIAARFGRGEYRSSKRDVMGFPGVEDSEVKDAQLREMGSDSTYAVEREDEYEIFRLWAEVDYNEDDVDEQVCIDYHHRTGTILSVTPYRYRTRPYSAARYLKRDKMFYGLGVPEILQSIQAGVNTNLNQAIDNATIANVRAFATRRNSIAAESVNDYYPGKKILFDDPGEVQAFQLGEVYPSIFEVGRVLQGYAERRTGISDYNLGRESALAGGDATATSTLALLQESSRRFDLYAKDLRIALSELGMQALELIQQFQPTEEIYAVLGTSGEVVEQALQPGLELRRHMFVTTTAGATNANKEVAKQNAITAFGIVGQYLDKLTPVIPALVDPTVPPPIKEFLYKCTQLGEYVMGKVLAAFDLEEVADMLPQTEGLLHAGNNVQAAVGLDQGGGMGTPGQAGVPNAEPMAAGVTSGNGPEPGAGQ